MSLLSAEGLTLGLGVHVRVQGLWLCVGVTTQVWLPECVCVCK